MPPSQMQKAGQACNFCDDVEGRKSMAPGAGSVAAERRGHGVGPRRRCGRGVSCRRAIGEREAARFVNQLDRAGDAAPVGARPSGRIEGHDLGTGLEDLANLGESRRDVRVETGVLALDQAYDGKAHARPDGAQVGHTLDAEANCAALLRGLGHGRNEGRIVDRRAAPSLNGDDQAAAQCIERAHPRNSPTSRPSAR